MDIKQLKQAAEKLLPFLDEATDRSSGEGESWKSQEFADAVEEFRKALGK
jgi:hypothetical protein